MHFGLTRRWRSNHIPEPKLVAAVWGLIAGFESHGGGQAHRNSGVRPRSFFRYVAFSLERSILSPYSSEQFHWLLNTTKHIPKGLVLDPVLLLARPCLPSAVPLPLFLTFAGKARDNPRVGLATLTLPRTGKHEASNCALATRPPPRTPHTYTGHRHSQGT